MNLRQLQTLTTFLEQGSFAATGDTVGLSHSAISVQMQRLEEELGATLFDRTNRPPTLTREGTAVAAIARDILGLMESMKSAAVGEELPSAISMGFVPTAVPLVLPRVLQQLRSLYPALQIKVKSGLSADLATAVLRRELDFALMSSPAAPIPELTITEVAREPLFVIGPPSLSHITSDAALAGALSFISFNRRTWLGQQIAAQLQLMGIQIKDAMEVDSIEAIERLVAEGFGVSIVPQRLLAPPLSAHLTQLPFGEPVQTRRLVLIERAFGRQTALEHSVRRIFGSLAN